MPSDPWKTSTFASLIGDDVLLVSDGYRAKNSELGGDGLIFLRAGHVADSHIDFSGADRFYQHLAPRLIGKTSQAGDVMVTTKGNSIGRVSYVAPDMPKFVYSPHLSFWRSLQPDKLVPGFLRAWSKSAEFREQLHALSYGTDMAPYFSLIDQKRLRITLPPPAVQCTIAHILGTLDDKIELNRHMNQTLEEMARALFHSWFVAFDPVRAKAEGRQPVGMDAATAALFPDAFEETEHGEIPAGWRIGTLGEIVTNPRQQVSPEQIDPDMPYIGLEHMPRRRLSLPDWGTGKGINSGKFAFSKGDVLFGKLRPYFHKVGVAPIDGICSTDILVLTPKSPDWFGFALGYLSSDEVVDFADRGSQGTRMPRTNWNQLAQYPVALPPNAIVQDYTTQLTPLVDEIIANVHESRTLAVLRDSLLPKLLSGELRVSQAESLSVGAAMMGERL